MSVNELLTLVTQVLFILLSVVAIFDYLRHRNPSRRDFALMASALGLPLGITLLKSATGVQSGLLDVLGAFALFSQPYFLFRLLQYFRPSRPGIGKAVVLGMILCWAMLFVLMSINPILTISIIFGYCVIVEAYCTLGYSREMQSTSGTLRRRLRFITVSSGFFTLAFAVNILNVLFPALAPGSGPIAQAAAAVSAILYYVAFLPPRWLRRAWQLEDLRDYLSQSRIGAARDIHDAESFQQLCRMGTQAVNGTVGGVVAREETSGEWATLGVTDSPGFSRALASGQQVIERAWERRQSAFIYVPDHPDADERRQLETAGARTWLFVPILVQERLWGLLLVLLRDRSLFVDDDLGLLELLAQQCAIVLENHHLIEELQHHSEQLEQKVEERTTELRAGEARFARVLDVTAEAVITVDSSQQIILFNQSAERIFGYTAGEALGQPLDILLPPNLVGRHHRFLREFSEGEDIARGMGQRGRELFARHKNGSIFPIEASISKLTEGDQVILTVFVRDVTEQREAEAALRESEGRYHDIIDNMLEGFQILGFDWRYLYVNDAAAQYGRVEKEDLLGYTVAEKYPGIETTEMFAAMQHCMEERTPQRAEFEFSYPDGSQAWFQFSIQPVPQGISILSLDITERKKSEAALQSLNEELEKRVLERTTQLQATNKELEAFSYSVSHDLRAPLRALDGFSQALEEDYTGKLDEDGRHYLGRIRANSQRMGEMIDDLLELSRLTRSETRREEVDLTALARLIAAELQEQYPGHAVDFRVEDGLRTVGDAMLLRAALRNLLNNAWKYTGRQPAPRVEFGCMNHEGQQVFFVRDNGAGFDMAYADKLFGAFQRLHGANEFPGNGIGLATVQRIINRHGGQIWAEAAVNQGATFYFSM